MSLLLAWKKTGHTICAAISNLDNMLHTAVLHRHIAKFIFIIYLFVYFIANTALLCTTDLKHGYLHEQSLCEYASEV